MCVCMYVECVQVCVCSNTRITHSLTRAAAAAQRPPPPPPRRPGNVKFVENCRIRFIIKKFFDAISSSTPPTTAARTPQLPSSLSSACAHMRADIRQWCAAEKFSGWTRTGLHTAPHTPPYCCRVRAARVCTSTRTSIRPPTAPPPTALTYHEVTLRCTCHTAADTRNIDRNLFWLRDARAALPHVESIVFFCTILSVNSLALTTKKQLLLLQLF